MFTDKAAQASLRGAIHPGWLLPACPPCCFGSFSATLPSLVSDLSRSKKREGVERGRRVLPCLILASVSLSQETFHGDSVTLPALDSPESLGIFRVLVDAFWF